MFRPRRHLFLGFVAWIAAAPLLIGGVTLASQVSFANQERQTMPANGAAADRQLPFSVAQAAGRADASSPQEQEEGGTPDTSPLKTARTVEPGKLENPYAGNYEEVAEEGHELYMAAGCNGCHGGTGGGGMGPPLSNPIWIYGNDDEALFRLTALGTEEFLEQGYSRQATETMMGPMPVFGEIVKSTDDLWKIVSWIKSLN